MAYRIDYGHAGGVRKPVRLHRSRLGMLTGVVFLLFLVLTHFIWPEGRNGLRNVLIPGDPDVTVSAFETLVCSFRSGGSFPEAVVAFCREILLYG